MMKNTNTNLLRQEYLDQMFRFLNQVRACGSINMFGASPALVEMYNISPKEARTVLAQWMEWASQDPDNLLK